MEMVGNVANVVSLVEVAIKLAKQLGIFIKDMRDAPRDMRDIDLDLRSTHFQLLQIKEALQTPGEAGVLGSHEHRKEFRCLLEELKSLFDDLLELMQEHDSIDSPYLRRAKWANVGKMKAELLRKRLKRQKFALLLTLQWSHGHSVSATHRSLLHRQNEQQNQIRFITEQLRRQSDREDISTDEVHTQSWLGILSTLATVSALPRKDPRRAYQSSASSSATNLSNSVTTIGSETSSTTSRPVPPTSGHIFDTLLCDIESIIIAQQTAAPEDFRGLHGVEICSTIMQGLCVGDDLFGSDNAGKERYRSLLFDLLHPQGGSAQFLDQNVSARRIVLGSLDGAEDHVASINSGVADDTYWDDENIHLPDINPPPYSRELALYEDEAQSRLPAINPLPARCAALRHSNMPALSPGSKRKILWIPLLPALYSCVEYVKQTTTGYDAMLFEEVTIKSFCYDASSTLQTAAWKKSCQKLNEALQLNKSFDMDSFQGNPKEINTQACQSLFVYFGSCSPLIPAEVAKALDGQPFIHLEAILYEAVWINQITIETYQTLRYLLEFFNYLVSHIVYYANPAQKKQAARNTAEALARSFCVKLGITSSETACELILNYKTIFSGMLVPKGNGKNSFQFIDRTVEGLKVPASGLAKLFGA